MEVLKLSVATACTSLSAMTIILAPASATAARSAGSYCIDVGADQIVLLGSSHSRLGFSPSKEARAGVVRDRQTGSILEEIMMRLHDIFAKKFELNLAEIEDQVLELGKQCFSRVSVIRFPESLKSSVEEQMEHQSKFLVQLDQSIVLRFLPQQNSILIPNLTTL